MQAYLASGVSGGLAALVLAQIDGVSAINGGAGMGQVFLAGAVISILGSIVQEQVVMKYLMK